MAESTKSKWAEYGGRFAYGGTVTVLTGLAAKKFGPAVGGLFLAFPSILPASLTLVREHDGRKKAADDARGAIAGSVGLACFAGFVWSFGARWNAILLFPVALAVWLAVGAAVWATFLRRS
jgi:hypothetical protein